MRYMHLSQLYVEVVNVMSLTVGTLLTACCSPILDVPLISVNLPRRHSQSLCSDLLLGPCTGQLTPGAISSPIQTSDGPARLNERKSLHLLDHLNASTRTNWLKMASGYGMHGGEFNQRPSPAATG